MQDDWEMAILVVSEMIQILDKITDRTILFDVGVFCDNMVRMMVSVTSPKRV
jgi:hypothetical protein